MPGTLRRSATIDDALRASGGRPSGFDYLRLALAISVVLSHSASVACGDIGSLCVWRSPARPLVAIIVPMFFALSGFLVTASLERCRTVPVFLGFRAVRIYPALIVEVILSALVIGPLVTTVPLHDYFSSPLFARYLLNMTGRPSYYLPGVFAHGMHPGIVNSQLWTVPYELFCYVGLGALWLFGLRRRRWLAVAVCALATIVLVGLKVWALGLHRPEPESVTEGLVLCFLSASGFYLYRREIPLRPAFFVVALEVSVTLLYFGSIGGLLAAPFIGYLTVYLGAGNPRRMGPIGRADISYGIYVYGTVLLQLTAFLFPGMRNWFLLSGASLLLIIPVASLSWVLVERPALGLRKLLTRFDRPAPATQGEAVVAGE